MSRTKFRQVSPSKAVELYLEDKKADDVAVRTIETYRSELQVFVDWCESQDINHIADIDGLTFKQYKLYLSDRYAQSTASNRLRTAKTLLEWCTTIDAADPEVINKIEVKRKNDVRSSEVTAEQAEAILDRLQKFHYASMDHVVFELLWNTGARLGTIRALDINDFKSNPDDANGPYIRAIHRPKTGTPLKNGDRGERTIGLSDTVATVLEDYLAVERPNVTDKYDRSPLLATLNGRPALSTLRAVLYAISRPCWYGKECPVGKTPSSCEAAQTKRAARHCPENNSPHDVRRGRITHYRRNEVPKEIVSDRCDVSPQVLEKHYNEMSETEKMEQRRNYLNNI